MGSPLVLVGPGLGTHTDPGGGLWPLLLRLALNTAEGTSPGRPPTPPWWWHLPGCRGVSSHAGDM